MTWRTGITRIAPGEIRTRGYDQADLMADVPFSDVVYLLFTGELPGPDASAVFRAVLTACVDHGVTPPSTQAARLVTSGGGSLPSAVGGGLLAIGEHHGGAMRELQAILEGIAERATDDAAVGILAAETVAEYRDAGDRLPGFGHRIHPVDPRAERLLDLVVDRGVAGYHTMALRELEAELADATGRDLPVNVDGAIAAALADLGVDRGLSRAVFVVGRAAGLAAHAHEEATREDPMRSMGPGVDDVEYDGPGDRDLPKRE